MYAYNPTPTQDNRLLKLIRFLEALPERNFNFALEVSQHEKSYGTVCCAIGWTPRVFPKTIQWVFDKEKFQEFAFNDTSASYALSAEYLFGIDYIKAGDLFFPGYQHRVDSRLQDVDDHATPKQVSAMLREFRKLC